MSREENCKLQGKVHYNGMSMFYYGTYEPKILTA
jgi:hypothetical protein